MKKKSDHQQISVMVPPPLKRWCEQRAQADGINTAAWVRRLIMAEKVRQAAV